MGEAEALRRLRVAEGRAFEFQIRADEREREVRTLRLALARGVEESDGPSGGNSSRGELAAAEEAKEVLAARVRSLTDEKESLARRLRLKLAPSRASADHNLRDASAQEEALVAERRDIARRICAAAGGGGVGDGDVGAALGVLEARLRQSGFVNFSALAEDRAALEGRVASLRQVVAEDEAQIASLNETTSSLLAQVNSLRALIADARDLKTALASALAARDASAEALAASEARAAAAEEAAEASRRGGVEAAAAVVAAENRAVAAEGEAGRLGRLVASLRGEEGGGGNERARLQEEVFKLTRDVWALKAAEAAHLKKIKELQGRSRPQGGDSSRADALELEVHAAQIELSSARRDAAGAAAEARAWRAAAAEAEEAARSKAAEVDALKIELGELLKSNATLVEEAARVVRALDASEAKRSEAEAKATDGAETAREALRRLGRAEEAAARAASEGAEDVARMHRRAEEAAKRSEASELSARALEVSLSELKRRAEALDEAKLAAEVELASLREKVAKMSGGVSLRADEAESASLRAELSARNEEVAALRAELSSKRSEWDRLTRSIEAKRSEAEARAAAAEDALAREGAEAERLRRDATKLGGAYSALLAELERTLGEGGVEPQADEGGTVDMMGGVEIQGVGGVVGRALRLAREGEVLRRALEESKRSEAKALAAAEEARCEAAEVTKAAELRVRALRKEVAELQREAAALAERREALRVAVGEREEFRKRSEEAEAAAKTAREDAARKAKLVAALKADLAEVSRRERERADNLLNLTERAKRARVEASRKDAAARESLEREKELEEELKRSEAKRVALEEKLKAASSESARKDAALRDLKLKIESTNDRQATDDSARVVALTEKLKSARAEAERRSDALRAKEKAEMTLRADLAAAQSAAAEASRLKIERREMAGEATEWRERAVALRDALVAVAEAVLVETQRLAEDVGKRAAGSNLKLAGDFAAEVSAALSPGEEEALATLRLVEGALDGAHDAEMLRERVGSVILNLVRERVRMEAFAVAAGEGATRKRIEAKEEFSAEDLSELQRDLLPLRS